MEEVIQRGDPRGALWGAGRNVEVGPVGGDQRLASVRQNEHELQAVGHAGLPQNLQRLSLEWMMRTRDGYAFGELLMVGSVSCLPSIRFPTTN